MNPDFFFGLLLVTPPAEADVEVGGELAGAGGVAVVFSSVLAEGEEGEILAAKLALCC